MKNLLLLAVLLLGGCSVLNGLHTSSLTIHYDCEKRVRINNDVSATISCFGQDTIFVQGDTVILAHN